MSYISYLSRTVLRVLPMFCSIRWVEFALSSGCFCTIDGRNSACPWVAKAQWIPEFAKQLDNRYRNRRPYTPNYLRFVSYDGKRVAMEGLLHGPRVFCSVADGDFFFRLLHSAE